MAPHAYFRIWIRRSHSFTEIAVKRHLLVDFTTFWREERKRYNMQQFRIKMSKYVETCVDYFLVLHHKCFQMTIFLNPGVFHSVSRRYNFPKKLQTIRLKTEEGSRVKTLRRHIVSEHFCVSESQRCSSFFFLFIGTSGCVTMKRQQPPQSHATYMFFCFD